MKKRTYIAWLMLFCAVCLLLGACSSTDISSVSSGGSAEETILEGSAGYGVSADPPSEDSSGEPLDVPEVVTRSHMAEVLEKDAEEDIDWVSEALQRYAGQDTVYRVQVEVTYEIGIRVDDTEEEAEAKRARRSAFHRLLKDLYDAERFGRGTNGGDTLGASADYIAKCRENFSDGFYGTLYYDEEAYWLCCVDYIPTLYAELPEKAIRSLLDNETVIALVLIDEMPEHRGPYKTMATFYNDRYVYFSMDIMGDSVEELLRGALEQYEQYNGPYIITPAYMKIKTGKEENLLQEALDIYAGRDDTEFQVAIRVNWQDKQVRRAFDALAKDLYYAHFYRVCSSTCEEHAKYVEMYRNGLYGVLEYGQDVEWESTPGFIPELYALLNEKTIRTLLDMDGVTVELVEMIPIFREVYK